MTKISLPVLFLSLFVIASFLSFEKMFGEMFRGLPFFLSIVTLVSHIIYSLVTGKKLVRFNSSFVLLLLLTIVSLCFTYFITVDSFHSRKIWADFYKCIVLCWLISCVIRDERELRYFFYIIVLVAIYISYFYVNYPDWHDGRAHFTGSYVIGDPNGVSLWLLSCLPFSWVLFAVSKSNVMRIVFVGSNVLFLRAVFEAQSRGGFIGLTFILFAFLFLLMKEKKFDISKKMLLGIVVLSVVMFSFIRYMPPQYLSRISEITNPQQDTTGSSEARLNAMRLAFEYIIENPFSKYGIGNHSYYIAEIYGQSPSELGEDLFAGSYLAHSLFLQYGADTGLVPMMIYSGFVVSLLLNLRRVKIVVSSKIPLNPTSLFYINATLASLSGFLVGAFFLPWAYSIFLFYISGISMAVVNIYSIGHNAELAKSNIDTV